MPMHNPKKPAVVRVIPAGGSGTRLWPLTREAYPTRFCALVARTLLHERRCMRHNCRA